MQMANCYQIKNEQTRAIEQFVSSSLDYRIVGVFIQQVFTPMKSLSTNSFEKYLFLRQNVDTPHATHYNWIW